MKRFNISQQIFLFLILGILFGLFLKINYIVSFIKYINFDLNIFKKIGIMFVNLLKMLSAPFIFTSMTISIFSLNNNKTTKLRSITIKTITTFIVMTSLCSIIGIIFAIIFKPGSGINIELFSDIVKGYVKSNNVNNANFISDIIFGIIPTNLFDTFLKSNFLQVIIFATLFAISILNLDN